MKERKPGFFHRHTLAGRREEYRAKYAHLLDESQGVIKYKLEQRIEKDADNYARREVALDILGVALVTGVSAFTINELRKGTLEETLYLIGERIVAFGEEATVMVKDATGRLKSAADRSLTHIGAQFGNGLGEGLMPHVEDALKLAEERSSAIGEKAVGGAMSAIIPLMPMAGSMVEGQAETAGRNFVGGAIAGLREHLPELVQSISSHLRFPGLVFKKQA